MSSSRRPKSAAPAVSLAGYAESADGQKVIPASVRPDGTIRKERRVREGYVNQEEVAKYQPRGAMASREPAPKCPGWYEEDEPKKPAASKPKQPAQQQQQQQKPAKEQAAKPAGEKAPAGKGKGKEGAGPTAPAVPPGLQPPAPQEPSETPLDKKVRNAKKKLRQVEEKTGKMPSGELTAEQKEQLAKLEALRKEVAELEAQLAASGIDTKAGA